MMAGGPRVGRRYARGGGGGGGAGRGLRARRRRQPQGAAVITCPSALNALKVTCTYDHSW
jgi:hypothetical protein